MKPFIALDWGTTSFRAYEVDADGKVISEKSAAEGILAVKDQKFEETLEHHIGGWSKSLPVIASGMITSRQGWVECPYTDCPAGISDLARSITHRTTSTARTIHFITGLHYSSPTIKHDVLRGEETQVFGSLSTGATHFVTPGTHSKWIEVIDGRLENFATYVTGESFALYRNHSLLGRLIQGDMHNADTFKRGVEQAFADPAGLLHILFSARSLGLYNALPAEGLHSYLSGLLVGQEVAHATMEHDRAARYLVLASPKIGQAYVDAMTMAGLDVALGDPFCAIAGQRLIAHEAGVI